MKMQTIFKLSVLAIALSAAGQASAGVTTVTAPVFATEIFGNAATAAQSVALPAVAGTFVTNTAAASTNTIKIQLAGGVTFDTIAAAPVLALTGGTLTAGSVSVSFGVSSGAALVASNAATPFTASNADVMYVTFSQTVAASTAFSITGLKIHAAGLATATGSGVTVSHGYYNAAVNSTTAPATALTEAMSAAVALATSVKATTITMAQPTNTPVVDVNATPARKKYLVNTTTNLTAVSLGKVTVATAATADATAVANSYQTAATNTRQLAVSIAAPIGGFAGMGTTKKAWLESGACTVGAGSALAGSPSALFTGTTATTALVATLGTTTTAPTSGTTYEVCMEVDGLTVLPAAQYTVTAATADAIVAATTRNSNDTLTTALANVTANGQTKTLSTYVPAAVAGYTTLVRVINTGAVAADVNLSVTPETTGVTFPAPTAVITQLAPGATTNLTAALIEANLAGAPAGTFGAAMRPRITVSSPTSGMVVQNFVVTPNGALTELSAQAAQ